MLGHNHIPISKCIIREIWQTEKYQYEERRKRHMTKYNATKSTTTNKYKHSTVGYTDTILSYVKQGPRTCYPAQTRSFPSRIQALDPLCTNL